MASKSRLRGLSPNDIASATETSVEPPSPAKIKAARVDHRLLSYEDIPGWCKDNKYILHGYRSVSGSTRTSLYSWFYMHNESLNIYTHFFLAVAFLVGLGAFLHHLHREYPNITATQDFIFIFFFLTAAGCLLLSTMYHTLSNHSIEVDALWLRMDFGGVVLLTLGGFVSGIYMVFWCEPLQRKIYWSMVYVLYQISYLVRTYWLA